MWKLIYLDNPLLWVMFGLTFKVWGNNLIRRRFMSFLQFTLFSTAGILIAGSMVPAAVYNFQDGVNSYDGTQDASLYAGDPQGINTGASPTIYTNGVHRGVLSFDLSSLIGQTVTGDATLTLKMADNHVGIAFSLFAIEDANAGWLQGDNPAYAPAGAGEVTWESKSHPGTPWVGGDGLQGAGGYNPTAVDSGVGGAYNTDVVLTLPQALVQHWIDTANGGLLILSDNQGEPIQFRSSDDEVLARPVLQVTAVPEPAAMSLIGLAALILRRRK